MVIMLHQSLFFFWETSDPDAPEKTTIIPKSMIQCSVLLPSAMVLDFYRRRWTTSFFVFCFETAFVRFLVFCACRFEVSGFEKNHHLEICAFCFSFDVFCMFEACLFWRRTTFMFFFISDFFTCFYIKFCVRNKLFEPPFILCFPDHFLWSFFWIKLSKFSL